MAQIYSEKYDGYIADVPDVDFERCDGTVFSFYEVNTANMTNTANSLTITGGQGNYPLAYIETDKSLELTFASSQFTMGMFEMANSTTAVDGDASTLESARYEVEEGGTLTIPYEVQPNSVKIRGLTEDTVAASGKFKVEITEATGEADGKTVVTLDEGDAPVGTTLRVAYKRRVVDAHRVFVKTNSTTAKGALYAHYPVYSAGTDCTEASIKGKLHLWLPRCRCTALPGFDSSLTFRLPVQ